MAGTCVRGLFVAIVAAAVSTVPAAAQTNTGQISGTIRDGSGAVLPGVTVTITNVGTAIARSDVTNDVGFYRITALPVGIDRGRG